MKTSALLLHIISNEGVVSMHKLGYWMKTLQAHRLVCRDGVNFRITDKGLKYMTREIEYGPGETQYNDK